VAAAKDGDDDRWPRYHQNCSQQPRRAPCQVGDERDRNRTDDPGGQDPDGDESGDDTLPRPYSTDLELETTVEERQTHR